MTRAPICEPTCTAEAVVFDLDGTLVDTTAAVEASWRRVAREAGVPYPALEPFVHGIPAHEVANANGSLVGCWPCRPIPECRSH